MGGIIIFVGGVIVLFGAMEFLGPDEADGWQKPAKQIAAGLAVAGVGVVMKFFGV